MCDENSGDIGSNYHLGITEHNRNNSVRNHDIIEIIKQIMKVFERQQGQRRN